MCQDGAYGAFCEAWISEETPGMNGRRSLKTFATCARVEDAAPKMRWVQLVKATTLYGMFLACF